MILRFIQVESHRLIHKKSAWFALLIFIAASVHSYSFIRSEQPIPENIAYEASHVFYYFTHVQTGLSSYLMFLLPLIVLMATGDFFARERRSSILSYSLLRTTTKEYIKSKLFSIGFISFIFMFICQLILFVYSMIIFPINLPMSIDEGITPYYASELYVGNPWLYIILIIFNSSLMAMFMSVLSIISSILFRNIYAAVILPYVIFVGISETLMSAPMFLGSSGAVFYDYSPLVMSGDYIVIPFSWWVVPLYWALMISIGSFCAYFLFLKKYKKGTLL